MRDLLILAVAYGLGWGGYYFWAFERRRNRVLANPEHFSERTVRFYTKSTSLKKALLSFFLALSVPATMAVILGIARFLFNH